MAGINKFHDEEYDGIVLKIPSWFIGMNGIESMVLSVKKELENCNKSMYYPDHISNLYELEEYKSKSELLKQKQESNRIESEKREKEYNNIIFGETKILKWVKYSEAANENTKIGNEYYPSDDFYTNKMNIKAEYKKLITEHIKTFDDFIAFIQVNFQYLYYVIKDTTDELVDWRNLWFTVGYASTLYINVNLINVQTDIKPTKDNSYTYRKTQLKFKDGNYGIEKGNEFVSFKGYKMKHLKLIK